MKRLFVFLAAAGCLVAPLALRAQQQPQGPVVVSPDVQSDRRVTFRILAPNAQKVELRTPGDIPGIGGRGGTPLQFTKNAEGVWESTTAAIPAGAYRYVVRRRRRRGGRFAQPGDEPDQHHRLQPRGRPRLGRLRHEERAARRGRVGLLQLDVARRHPPDARLHAAGLRGGQRDKYPVFYLLHGAGDVDDSWTSVGRAGFILDNLIAAGQGEADDRRDAGGPRERRRHGARRAPRRRRPAPVIPPARAAGSVRPGLRDRSDALRREELSRAHRSAEPRDRGPVDGRQPDAQHRDSASRQVRLRRRVQLGHPRRRRPWRRARRARRRRPAAAVRRSVGEGRTSRRSTTRRPSADCASSGSAPAKKTA